MLFHIQRTGFQVCIKPFYPSGSRNKTSKKGVDDNKRCIWCVKFYIRIGIAGHIFGLRRKADIPKARVMCKAVANNGKCVQPTLKIRVRKTELVSYNV